MLEETHQKIDVAVSDLGLSDGYGADLIKELREKNSQAQALVLSATLDRAQIARAVEHGAAGVTQQDGPPRRGRGAAEVRRERKRAGVRSSPGHRGAHPPADRGLAALAEGVESSDVRLSSAQKTLHVTLGRR